MQIKIKITNYTSSSDTFTRLILLKSTDSIWKINPLIFIISPIFGIIPLCSKINPANESDSPFKSSKKSKSTLTIFKKSINKILPSKT